jgi:UDP-GlcNAc:undecaprenyl-phosphate GlcNAc-1-phosphate transferase
VPIVNHLLATGLASFLISLVLTPIFRDVFRSFRVVDQPDRNRKVHVYPVPRVGGIAIAISYFVVFQLIRPEDSLSNGQLSTVFRILPAALLVFATGLIDDFFGLKPWQKFLGQFLAAGLAWWAGVRISVIGYHDIEGMWAAPLTIVWLVLCTNAFNLVDGLDGLASGLALFGTMTIFTAAIIQGNGPLAFATVALAGSLVGFLCFNFNPATVFLGDCGSLLIGFLLGCFGVIWSQKSLTLLGMTAPMIAISVPLLDVLLCVVRRWLRNKPIFGADRGHIHHKLLDRGLTPKQTVFVLYGLSSIAAIFSLAQSLIENAYLSLSIGVAFVAVVWFVVHKLRYAELMFAGRLLRLGALQRGVSASLELATFEKSLTKAATPAELWTALTELSTNFGFAAVRMEAGGRYYEQWSASVNGPGYWTVRVPLGEDGDFVELARAVGSPVLPMAVAPFLDVLAGAFSSRMMAEEQPAPVLEPSTANRV